jgi:hypothetical protein
MRDMDAEVLGLGGGIRAPNLRKKLTMGEDLSGVPDQQPEQGVLDWGESHVPIIFAHTPGRQVDLERSVAKERFKLLAAAVAQRRPETGQELAGAERLGYVIIRACVKGGDLVCVVVSNTEDEYRDAAPFAQALEHRQTVQIGETEVEQNDLWPALGSLQNAIASSGRIDDAVAIAFKRDAQETADLCLVVDDKRGRRYRVRVAHAVP